MAVRAYSVIWSRLAEARKSVTGSYDLPPKFRPTPAMTRMMRKPMTRAAIRPKSPPNRPPAELELELEGAL